MIIQSEYATWRDLGCLHVHNEKWVFIWTWLSIYIGAGSNKNTNYLREHKKLFHVQNYIWFTYKTHLKFTYKNHVQNHIWFTYKITYHSQQLSATKVAKIRPCPVFFSVSGESYMILYIKKTHLVLVKS